MDSKEILEDSTVFSILQLCSEGMVLESDCLDSKSISASYWLRELFCQGLVSSSEKVGLIKSTLENC